MHLVADPLADQARRLTSQARTKALPGPSMAATHAALREPADSWRISRPSSVDNAGC